MKKYLLTLGLLGLASAPYALGNTGSVWAGQGCGGEQPSTVGFRYCMANISSVTTVTQLGKQTVYPNKQIYIVGGISGTVSGVVTPTVTLYLGNRPVAQQTVSLTTAGNVVNLGSVPYFNGMTVSISTPGLLGTSQSALISVIENDK